MPEARGREASVPQSSGRFWLVTLAGHVVGLPSAHWMAAAGLVNRPNARGHCRRQRPACAGSAAQNRGISGHRRIDTQASNRAQRPAPSRAQELTLDAPKVECWASVVVATAVLPKLSHAQQPQPAGGRCRHAEAPCRLGNQQQGTGGGVEWIVTMLRSRPPLQRKKFPPIGKQLLEQPFLRAWPPFPPLPPSAPQEAPCLAPSPPMDCMAHRLRNQVKSIPSKRAAKTSQQPKALRFPARQCAHADAKTACTGSFDACSSPNHLTCKTAARLVGLRR